MVNKDWTLKDALDANDAALRENPERGYSDPTLPLYRWFAMRELDIVRDRYEQGNSFALMQAIRVCANHDLVMPEWVANGYIKAFDTILNYKSKDWNEVFSNPIPKGEHLNALRKKRALRFAVFNEATDILKHNPERAIDAGLYEEAGKKFGVGKTLAEEYCREVEKIERNSLSEHKRYLLDPYPDKDLF